VLQLAGLRTTRPALREELDLEEATEAAPFDLLGRLRAALDEQGSPAIAATPDGDHFLFAAETGEWMLAARVWISQVRL
jgi:hypothetical protein